MRTLFSTSLSFLLLLLDRVPVLLVVRETPRIKKKSKEVHFVLAERKRLFLEPPKTSFSENRLISLTSDVVGFQRFHCIILESSQEWTKGLYLHCYPIRYLVCPVEVPLCEMKVNRYSPGQTTYNGIFIPGGHF